MNGFFTHKQFAILEALRDHGPLFGNEIAEKTGQWRPFVYSRTFDMVDWHCVEFTRESIPNTKVYRYRFYITHRGRNRLNERTPSLLFRFLQGLFGDHA
jgi:hypothetical protein